MAHATGNGDHASTAPVAGLVKQVSEQTSRLARQEVDLAKTALAGAFADGFLIGHARQPNH
jgi:hypothetical protein